MIAGATTTTGDGTTMTEDVTMTGNGTVTTVIATMIATMTIAEEGELNCGMFVEEAWSV